jgi:hypothetical protein
MRKLDKLKNIRKVNLLIEQRYLSEFNGGENEVRLKQLYSGYLDTIFPNSDIKKILYHGTKSKELEGGSFRVSQDGTYGSGVYFFDRNHKYSVGEFGDNTIFVKINSSMAFNNILLKQEWSKLANKLKDSPDYHHRDSLSGFINQYIRKEGYDTIIDYYGSDIVYVALYLENIHILGDEKDILSFKKYVEANKNNQLINEIKDGVEDLFNTKPNLKNIKINN